ncbi:MAG TPA: hypothetical protein VEX86_20915 [Longimicrobium sp.]|nr:hypothetical protein [Longimicrobium sp.]
MTITVYSFEKAGDEYGGFTTQDYREAKEYAAAHKLLIIANEFEWAESEPLDDFQTRADRRAALLARVG